MGKSRWLLTKMSENSVLTCRKEQDQRVHLTVLRALIVWWMMVLSCLLVLQPHWMTLIKSIQQPQTDNGSMEKVSFPMVYNTKWLFDCHNLVHCQCTQWYLAWQYPQWHLFGHEDISLKQLLWHLKVDKRIFYYCKNVHSLHEDILNKERFVNLEAF